MVEFRHFTSGITWRQKVLADGTLDSPEILRKWTAETGESKTQKPKKQTKRITTTLGDVVEL